MVAWCNLCVIINNLINHFKHSIVLISLKIVSLLISQIVSLKARLMKTWFSLCSFVCWAWRVLICVQRPAQLHSYPLETIMPIMDWYQLLCLKQFSRSNRILSCFWFRSNLKQNNSVFVWHKERKIKLEMSPVMPD